MTSKLFVVVVVVVVVIRCNMTTRIAPGVGANLLGQHSAERNQDATAYVGNLDPQVFFTQSPSYFGSYVAVYITSSLSHS